LRTLFDELRRDGFAAVARMIADKEQEGVALDFKEKSDASNGRLTREDRQTLAENLCAFANSAGGLLVLGIEARKNADQIDAASALKPIRELQLFKSEVTRAIGELMLPRHEGIEVFPILDPSVADSGYLAIWVERSDRRPHQSQAAKDRRYYKRAGDSTFVMEHYDIEDAFNRVAPTQLELICIGAQRGPRSQRGNYRTYPFHVEFRLRNSSRLSACAPYVAIVDETGGSIAAAHGGYLEHNLVGRTLFYGTGNTFVHPGQEIPVFKLTVEAGHYLGDSNWNHNGKLIGDSVVAISCDIGCQNAPVRRASFSWSGSALEDFLGV
jgi:hypothetical protein